MISFRDLLVGLAVVAAGCSGNAPMDDVDAALHPALAAGSEETLASAPPRAGKRGTVTYAGDADGRRGSVEIYYDGRHVRTIGDSYGEFQEELPPSTSSSGNIVLLHQVENGTLHVSPDEAQRHERYYCNFVDLRNGCLLERRTGEFCAGEWAEDDAWLDSDGRRVDLLAKRITAEQVARSNEPPADGPVWNYPNLQHCDPPSSHNRRSYTTLLDANVFSLSTGQLRAAREDLEQEW